MNERLVQKGDLWIVYRHSDTWGDCPLIVTKDESQARLLYKYVTGK